MNIKKIKFISMAFAICMLLGTNGIIAQAKSVKLKKSIKEYTISNSLNNTLTLNCKGNQTLTIYGGNNLSGIVITGKVQKINIQGCKNIKMLYIKAGVKQVKLRKLSKVKKLSLKSTRLNTFNFKQIPNVVEIETESSEDEKTVLKTAEIKDLKKIKRVNLSGCSKIKISNCPFLQEIKGCTGKNVYISKVPKLKKYEGDISNLKISNIKLLKEIIITNGSQEQIQSILDTAINLTDVKVLAKGIVKLEVSKLYKLKVLECYFIGLEELNISASKLQKLACQGNKMKKLDVSLCPDLLNLNCSQNQITELQLSDLQKLKYLDCGNNNLKNLDVTSNKGLKSLSCYKNLLNRLDVSANTSLYQLECYSNRLSELDLSGLPKLEYLRCYNNNINTMKLNTTCPLGVIGFDYGCNVDLNSIAKPQEIEITIYMKVGDTQNVAKLLNINKENLELTKTNPQDSNIVILEDKVSFTAQKAGNSSLTLGKSNYTKPLKVVIE